jgi:hypothetical protein
MMGAALQKPTLARSLTTLPVVMFAALFLRLGGVGATWLPSVVSLAGLALLALVLTVLVVNGRSLGTGIRTDWRGLLARHGFVAGLLLLALLALAVRLASIGTDLGHVPLDIDEHRLASNVKQFFVRGEIGHRTVEHYPGVLFWALTGTSLLLYLQGLMEGTLHSIRGMPVESFVLAGRLVSTVIASATVVVVGLIGRQMSGSVAGLVAAALIAISPLSVQTTTVLRNDPAQVLLVCAAIHAALASCSTDRRLWPVLAGVFGGAATAVKYTSVFILLPTVAAALMRGSLQARVGRAALVMVAFVLTVATTNHFLWWDFPNFVEQLSDQITITGPGHWAAIPNPPAFHAEVLAQLGVGWALLILAAGYGVYGLATGQRHAWVFWLFPLLYSWFTTKRPSQFPRWVFPLLPFVAVAGAAALVWVLSALRGARPLTRRRAAAMPATAVLTLVGIAVLSQPAWMGLVTASRRTATSTHSLAEQWLRQRPARDRVLLGDGWLDLTGSTLKIRRVTDLDATLRGSVYQLAASDWVVVPEPFFKNPGLKRLMFATRVSADYRRPGGNQGYDFEIYASPRLPPEGGPIEIRLDDVAADPFLAEWDAPGASHSGRPLPARGASLFLPPRQRETATVTVEVSGASPAGADPGFTMTDDAGAIALTDTATSEPSRRALRGVAQLAPGGRATELRLAPADRSRRVRVLRVLVD